MNPLGDNYLDKHPCLPVPGSTVIIINMMKAIC